VLVPAVPDCKTTFGVSQETGEALQKKLLNGLPWTETISVTNRITVRTVRSANLAFIDLPLP
jgi:hypothetical protein